VTEMRLLRAAAADLSSDEHSRLSVRPATTFQLTPGRLPFTSFDKA